MPATNRRDTIGVGVIPIELSMGPVLPTVKKTRETRADTLYEEIGERVAYFLMSTHRWQERFGDRTNPLGTGGEERIGLTT